MTILNFMVCKYLKKIKLYLLNSLTSLSENTKYENDDSIIAIKQGTLYCTMIICCLYREKNNEYTKNNRKSRKDT